MSQSCCSDDILCVDSDVECTQMWSPAILKNTCMWELLERLAVLCSGRKLLALDFALPTLPNCWALQDFSGEGGLKSRQVGSTWAGQELLLP
jgi:hypothetical protein